MRGLAIIVVIALFLSGAALAANYTITSIKPNSIAPGHTAYVFITLQNEDEAASHVRAYLISKTEHIAVTDSWEYLGLVEWKEKKTAIFAVHVNSVAEDDYPMRLEIKESIGPVYGFNFSLPVSHVPLSEEISYISDEKEDEEEWADGWENDDFRIELLTLLDESDSRIDPTDKVTIALRLYNKNTDKVFNVQGKLIEDFDNIKVPLLAYDFNHISGKETKIGYFNIDTIDVTPGEYRMNLSLVYDKDGKEHISKVPFDITVSGGYGLSVDLLPDSIETSPMEQVKFKVHIKNTGTVDDTYQIYFRGVSNWVEQAERTVIVAKNSERDVEVSVLIPDVSGTYTLTTEVISKTLSEVRDVDTSVISVRPEIKAIHQLDMSLDKHSTDVFHGDGETFQVMVQNLGNMKEAVAIKVKGADWAYLSQSTLELEPLQTKELTLYVAPSSDVQIGTHLISITATTFGGEASTKEQLVVYVAEAEKEAIGIGPMQMSGNAGMETIQVSGNAGMETIQVTGTAGIENGENGIGTGLVVLAKDIKGFGHPILTLVIIALFAAVIILAMRKEEPEKIVPLSH